MRGRVNAIRTFKGLVADLRYNTFLHNLFCKYIFTLQNYEENQYRKNNIDIISRLVEIKIQFNDRMLEFNIYST